MPNYHECEELIDLIKLAQANPMRLGGQPLQKGDIPGHEFHGNQYSGGGGAATENKPFVAHGSGKYYVSEGDATNYHFGDDPDELHQGAKDRNKAAGKQPPAAMVYRMAGKEPNLFEDELIMRGQHAEWPARKMEGSDLSKGDLSGHDDFTDLNKGGPGSGPHPKGETPEQRAARASSNALAATKRANDLSSKARTASDHRKAADAHTTAMSMHSVAVSANQAVGKRSQADGHALKASEHLIKSSSHSARANN